MANKRLRRFKQRKMHKRGITGKKPMSPEQKEIRKKIREAQSAASKVANEANAKRGVPSGQGKKS